MTSISIWISQIIIFLIVASIIGLIVPDNNMKKYVNIIIGLLLLLTFAKPLMILFSIDVPSHIKEVENMVYQDDTLQEQTEKSMNNQKKEIQATQDAYILKEIQEQMIKQANPDLIDQFDVEINQLTLHFIESAELDKDFENLESITVDLIKSSDESKQKDVDLIVIDTNNKVNSSRQVDHKDEIIEQLSALWGMKDSQIIITFE